MRQWELKEINAFSHQDSLELVVCHFNVHNVDYGYEWCVFFFLIYAEAIYRTGSIVNSPCLPFSMGMKKKFHNEKGFKGTTGL